MLQETTILASNFIEISLFEEVYNVLKFFSKKLDRFETVFYKYKSCESKKLEGF